jgi:hypothetical protein
MSKPIIESAVNQSPLPSTKPTGSFATGSEQPILEGLAPLKREMVDVLRSGYVPGSEGDRAYAAIHRVERWSDPAGNGDEVFCGSNIKQASRSPNYGYRAGEDEKHYDQLSEGVFDPSLTTLEGVDANAAHALLVRSGFKRTETLEPGMPGYAHGDTHGAVYEHQHDADNRVHLEWDAKTKRVHTALMVSEDVGAGDLAEMLKEVAEGYGIDKETALASTIATARQSDVTIAEVICAVASGMIEEALEEDEDDEPIDEDEDDLDDIDEDADSARFRRKVRKVLRGPIDVNPKANR